MSDRSPPSPDTRLTGLQWRIALWFVNCGLALAPAGTAKIALLWRLSDWAQECRTAWALRYPDGKGPQ